MSSFMSKNAEEETNIETSIKILRLLKTELLFHPPIPNAAFIWVFRLQISTMKGEQKYNGTVQFF